MTASMDRTVLQLDSRDNVLIALTDLKSGEGIQFDGQTYTLPKNVRPSTSSRRETWALGMTSLCMVFRLAERSSRSRPGNC